MSPIPRIEPIEPIRFSLLDRLGFVIAVASVPVSAGVVIGLLLR